MSSTTPTKSLRIAVLCEEVQLSDIVGVDILGNLSTEYFEDVLTMIPQIAGLRPHAMDMTFYYLASTLEGPAPRMTPSLKFVPNATYDSCPRDLDIVLIGGPMLTHRPAAADRFLKEAWTKTPIFMTTCIGALWLASSGVLEGRKATTNRGALGIAAQVHPDVEWVDQRWVVDEKPFDDASQKGVKGELWTSGGAGCGIEMIAHYCLEKFDPVFVRALALEGLDFDPEGSRGQFYSTPRKQ